MNKLDINLTDRSYETPRSYTLIYFIFRVANRVVYYSLSDELNWRLFIDIFADDPQDLNYRIIFLLEDKGITNGYK